MRRFWADAVDEFFSVDRGMPWTLWRLWRAPGALIESYLRGDDPRVTRPLRLALVQLALATLLLRATGASDGLVGDFRVGLDAGAGARVAALSHGMDWVLAHADLVLLCAVVPALAASGELCFRAARRDLAEHWIAAVFVFAQLALPMAALLALDSRVDDAATSLALLGVPALLQARAQVGQFGAAVRRPWLRAAAAAAVTWLLLLLALVATALVATALGGL